MSLEGKTLKLCSCNGTMRLDAKALAEALGRGAPLTIHRELCRKEAGLFRDALADPELLVACTQEAPLFSELETFVPSTVNIVADRAISSF